MVSGRAEDTWLAKATAIAGDLVSVMVMVLMLPFVLIVVAAPVVLFVKAILTIAGWF